ncbi:MAG TPA: regulatory protein GemA [bacterium]|nr:regulatory protein GemA [bacterium]
MSTITKDQIKRIHILKAALGWTEDKYRDVLAFKYGVESSKELEALAAAALINDMEQQAIAAGKWQKRPAKAPEKKRKYDELLGRDPFLASPAQLRMIEAMWQQVARSPEPDKALGHFLKRIVKCEHITWIDKNDAHKVIKALQQMGAQAKPTA